MAVDNTLSQFGHNLLDFLKDKKCCMLNGLILPFQGNFTCVSSRRRSIVEYIITPRLSMCKNFKVITCKDAIQTFNLETCISKWCKPSYHLILSLNFVISYFSEQTELIDVSVNDYSAECKVKTVNTRDKSKISKFTENFKKHEAWTNNLRRNNKIYRKLL